MKRRSRLNYRRCCADDQAGPRSCASGRRPARITTCLLSLEGQQKRHDRIGGRDLHPCSPPPVSQARRVAKAEGRRLRKFLALGFQLALTMPAKGQGLMLGRA
jgi:hypothetical protein